MLKENRFPYARIAVYLKDVATMQLQFQLKDVKVTSNDEAEAFRSGN